MHDDKNDRRRLFDQSSGRNPFGMSDTSTHSFYLAHMTAHPGQAPPTRATPLDDTNTTNGDYTHDDDNNKSTCAHTYQRLNAVKTAKQKKYGPARQGAKKAKALEKLQSVGPILNPEEATGYRAISARGNYLAQDKADMSYAAKELCREFSLPTKKSFERLKRMGRYLGGHKRLASKYGFLESIPDESTYMWTLSSPGALKPDVHVWRFGHVWTPQRQTLV